MRQAVNRITPPLEGRGRRLKPERMCGRVLAWPALACANVLHAQHLAEVPQHRPDLRPWNTAPAHWPGRRQGRPARPSVRQSRASCLLPSGRFPPISPRKERGTFAGISLLEAVRRQGTIPGEIMSPALAEVCYLEKKHPMTALRAAFHELAARVLALTDAEFLSPMNGWSPRDVVAHLIGWNRFMIQACRSIRAGEPPAYYTDTSADYRNINAAFVRYYCSRSRERLLADLSLSMGELEAYLAELPPSELPSKYGVTHHSGEPATVAKIIRSLAGDYEHYTRQINAWLATE